MLFIWTLFEYTSETAASIVAKIKNGDKQLREKFIKDYIPFIIKIISSFYSKKLFDVENRDEYSIGLIAFDEAIEKYDISKNKSFLSFAQIVIKRRLIDYFRCMNKKNIEIPFCSFNFKSNKELEEQLNMFKDEEESNKYDIIYELDKFSKELEAFGLSLKNMPYYIPKHKDSKSMCLRIAKSIIQNPIIHDRLMAKKYFHMKELAKIIDVSEKTIRRNREFIICICIIYGNNYEILKTYLNELLL